MRRVGIVFLLLIFVGVFLLGCKQQEYDELIIEKQEIENELSQIQNENISLKDEIEVLEYELSELNKDNKKIFDNMLSEREQFSMTGEEYINMIKIINAEPAFLRNVNAPIDVIENIEFVKTSENFMDTYSCVIYEDETTKEKLEIQIITLYTDDIVKIKIIYHHNNEEPETLKAGNYAFNYTLIVLGAFIMQDRKDTNMDEKFMYYLERFSTVGTYYEGNAWLLSKDEDGVFALDILPIGLMYQVNTIREEY